MAPEFDGVHLEAESSPGGAWILKNTADGALELERSGDSTVLALWPTVSGGRVRLARAHAGLGEVVVEVVRGACRVRPVTSRVMTAEVTHAGEGPCELELYYEKKPEWRARLTLR